LFFFCLTDITERAVGQPSRAMSFRASTNALGRDVFYRVRSTYYAEIVRTVFVTRT